MQIWDTEYFSTSDDEDNDEEDNSDEESNDKVQRKSKPIGEDVVDLLIKPDKVLYQRDLSCRLSKVQLRRAKRAKIFTLEENGEETEYFKKWWSHEIEDLYFAMYTRHRSMYRKGD